MLMDGVVKYGRIFFEDVLGAVSVMNVEIDDADAPDVPDPLDISAAMATLLKKQNPMARFGSAWWPGGRTAQKALSMSAA